MPSGKRQKNKIYAVAKGRKCGVYKTWPECESQTKGYKGAKFKSFLTLEEAQCFINSQSSSVSTTLIATKATNANTTSAIGRQVADQPILQNTTKVGLKLADERSVCFAVAKGHTPGLYRTWDECKRQTMRFSSPVFKKFSNGTDAVAFMALHNDDWYSGAKREEIRTNETTANTKAAKENINVGAEQQQHRPTKSLWIQLWFDGGSRGNPGIAGSGAHLIISTLTSFPKSQPLRGASNNNPSTKDNYNYGKVVSSKKTKVVNVRHYCGNKYTNNYAEYCGLREGLIEAKHHVDEFCNSIGSTLQNIGFGSSPNTPFIAADADVTGGNDTCEDWFYQIKLEIKGDSNLIIEQLNGNYACRKETLVELYQNCKEMIYEIKQKAKMKIRNTAVVEKNRNLVLNVPINIESGHNRISVVVSHMHVYRDKNAVADALANEAMDQRRSWKTYDGCSESDDNISVEII